MKARSRGPSSSGALGSLSLASQIIYFRLSPAPAEQASSSRRIHTFGKLITILRLDLLGHDTELIMNIVLERLPLEIPSHAQRLRAVLRLSLRPERQGSTSLILLLHPSNLQRSCLLGSACNNIPVVLAVRSDTLHFPNLRIL